MAACRPSSKLIGGLLKSSRSNPTIRSISISNPIANIPRPARQHSKQPSSRCTYSPGFSHRLLNTTSRLHEEPKTAAAASSSANPKPYTFPEIQSLTTSPSPTRILIDVREPSELADTGYIPTAINLPLKTSPDFAFLSPEEFEDRFGVPRPGKDAEVIFYCRSGVRSKAAAQLAQQAGFGGTVSEFPGSWLEWAEKGGKVERS